MSDPQASVVDKDLLGFWYKSKSQSKTVLMIARPRLSDELVPSLPKGLMTYSFMDISDDGEGRTKWSHDKDSIFFTSQVGEDKYGSSIELDKAIQKEQVLLWKPTGQFQFARYEVTGDTLKVIYCSTQGAARLVEAGILKGEVHRVRENTVSSVTITSSTDEIAAVVSGGERDTLFPPTDVETWRRVK
jgi:hypothetical protein